MKTTISVFKKGDYQIPCNTDYRLIIPREGHGLMLFMEYVSKHLDAAKIFNRITTTAKSIVIRLDIPTMEIQAICNYINSNE
jgi:hypothetical protein